MLKNLKEFKKNCYFMRFLYQDNKKSIFNKTITNKIKFIDTWQGLDVNKNMDFIIMLELDYKKDFTLLQKKNIVKTIKKVYKNFNISFRPCNFNNMTKNKTYYINIFDIFKNQNMDILKELSYYKKYNHKNKYNYFIVELLKLKNKGFNTITKKDFDILKNKYVRY